MVLAVAVALAYALALNDQWAIRGDSALYLALGRSLAEGRGMEYNGRQMWGYPPAVPALVAACRRATGLARQSLGEGGSDGYWLINFVMKALAVGTALAAMGIARRLSADRPEDERTFLAAMTLLVVGLSARLFTDATLIMTDVPFTFFIAVGLYSFLRARDGHWTWYLAGGAAVAAATWTRLLGPIIFAGMAAAMLLDTRPGYLRRLPGVVAAGAIVGASVLVWMFLVRARSDPGVPDYLVAAGSGYLDVATAQKWKDIAAEAPRIPSALCGVLVDQKLPWANLLPTATVFFGMWIALRRRQLLVVLPMVFYVGFLVVWGAGAVAGRYLLPVLPLAAYLLLIGAEGAAGRLVRAEAGVKWRRIAIAVAAGACVAVSLPKDARQVHWMQHPRFYAAYEHGEWADIVDAAAYLRERGRRPDDEVATDLGAIAGYLTRLHVTSQPLWVKVRQGSRRPLGPKEFAGAAARGTFRFVVVPGEDADWSVATIAEMGGTAAFGPPKTFGRVTVFERQ